MNIGVRIYRFRRILKYLFPTLVVIASCVLLSGPIALLTLMGINSNGFYKMIGLNTSDFFIVNNQSWGKNEPSSYSSIVAIIGGNVKVVMCSGLALFLNIIGIMGLYFWTRTDYKNYNKLWMVGAVFVFTAALGLQALWNYAYS